MAVVSEPELLRRDVHPAEVLEPDGTVHKALRVFVTSRRLVGYRATPAGEIVKALELQLQQPCSVPPSRASLGQGRLEARLADGRVVWVNRGHGCGCGSLLKTLAPPVGWSG